MHATLQVSGVISSYADLRFSTVRFEEVTLPVMNDTNREIRQMAGGCAATI